MEGIAISHLFDNDKWQPKIIYFMSLGNSFVNSTFVGPRDRFRPPPSPLPVTFKICFLIHFGFIPTILPPPPHISSIPSYCGRVLIWGHQIVTMHSQNHVDFFWLVQFTVANIKEFLKIANYNHRYRSCDAGLSLFRMFPLIMIFTVSCHKIVAWYCILALNARYGPS